MKGTVYILYLIAFIRTKLTLPVILEDGAWLPYLM
jgi:hypothetical protein